MCSQRVRASSRDLPSNLASDAGTLKPARNAPGKLPDTQERRHVGGHGLEGSLVKDFNRKDDPSKADMSPKRASKVPPEQPYEPPYYPPY